MGAPLDPIRPSEGPHRGPLRAHRAEAYKKREDWDLPDREGLSQEVVTLGSVLLFFKVFWRFFDLVQDRERAQEAYRPFYDDLIGMKEGLIRLQRDDGSAEPLYLMQLADHWRALHEASSLLDLGQRGRQQGHQLLDRLFAQVQGFPKDVDYGLGYYLSKYRGRDWFPVPFIEILKLLNGDYQRHGDRSLLVTWIELIDEMVAS